MPRIKMTKSNIDALPGGEISRLLRREIGKAWGSRSIHEITKRDVVEVVTAIEQRGAPIAANKTLKTLKTFFPSDNPLLESNFLSL